MPLHIHPLKFQFVQMENEGIYENSLKRKKPNTKNETRQAILLFLSQRHKNGRLVKGATEEAVTKFETSAQTIRRIWKLGRNGVLDPEKSCDVSSKKKGNCGRKKKWEPESLQDMVSIPLHDRQTLDRLSVCVGIAKTSLWRLLQNGDIKRHSSSLKPLLSDENKRKRVDFARSFVHKNGIFDPMYNYVHIDEKWFYITRQQQRFYLLPEEDTPYRACQSKRFITKVMFMAAVARPRYDPHRKTTFNGKIGIWPFVTHEPAKRNSKKRAKGTLVTKCIPNINRHETRKMLVENVIPAIKEKWPRGRAHSSIIIQQDNAKPHLAENDAELIAECQKGGWDISFRCQPPNSPDFNVLDLGFFNSIQALQHQNAPKSIDELIECVHQAFEDLEWPSLDDVFLSLQMVMNSCMKCEGGNQYKLEHMSKKKLRKKGELLESIVCTANVIQGAESNAGGNEDASVGTVLFTNGIANTEASVSDVNMICAHCGKTATGAHRCSLCKMVVHSICGTNDGSERYGASVVCYTCAPPRN